MSNRCVHCNEAWDFDDYVCPICDRAAVEQDSDMEPTLRYILDEKAGTYDVVTISTGKSIWE